MWTQTADGTNSSDLWNSQSRIVGINGNPRDWVSQRSANMRYITSPLNTDWRLEGIAYDYKYQTVYWSESNYRQIQSVSLDGSNVPITLFEGTSGKVFNLAMDWMHGNLYWTDSLYNWIALKSVRNQQQSRDRIKIVVSHDLDEPRGIVVYPQLR